MGLLIAKALLQVKFLGPLIFLELIIGYVKQGISEHPQKACRFRGVKLGTATDRFEKGEFRVDRIAA
jgi:hypothetical protein